LVDPPNRFVALQSFTSVKQNDTQNALRAVLILCLL